MSNDQKPARIKLISTGGPASRAAPAALPATGESVGTAEAAAQPARRSRLVPAILFLGGCAVGGAGLAAWPHFVG